MLERAGTSLFGPPSLAPPTRPCANRVKFSIGRRAIGHPDTPDIAIIHAVWMIGIDELAANVLVEVIGAAADRAHVDRRIRNARGLDPAMGSKVRVARENIHS